MSRVILQALSLALSFSERPGPVVERLIAQLSTSLHASMHSGQGLQGVSVAERMPQKSASEPERPCHTERMGAWVRHVCSVLSCGPAHLH